MGTPSERWVRHRVNCCACGRAMKTSRHINLVALGKKAKWPYPAAGNVVTGQPCIEAVAVVCDVCIEKKQTISWAVEWNQTRNMVNYHKIANLKPLGGEKQNGL